MKRQGHQLPVLDRSSLSTGLRRLINFYENVSPDNVTDLGDVYERDAFFKDPFNEVHSAKEIQHIFEKMFEQVNNPRFVVHTAFESNDQAFLGWEFLFEMQRFKKNEVQTCRGSTHVRLNTQGKVIYHRDYWDTAEELYEKIPVLGGLMRWLKKQAG